MMAADALHGALPRRTLLGLGAALTLPGCAVTAPSPAPLPSLADAPPVVLPRTHQLDIPANGRVHRITVSVPPEPPPSAGYPVLYVLDGNILFPLVAQFMRNQGIRSPALRRGTAVVVGLGYATADVLDLEARAHDYTPPAPGPATDERGRREGGADAFLDFVLGTVRPLVARSFAVDATRQTLFGHSYGGLCALHALFTHPGQFQTVVAASASVWWRDGFILQERDRFVAAQRAAAPGTPPTRLLMTAGEREEARANDPARAAVAAQRRTIGTSRDLVASLQGVPGIDARFLLFPGEDHGTSMAPAAQQAVALALGGPLS